MPIPYNLKSWNDAQSKMNALQKSITECQRQLNEIQAHTLEFVDNPKNIINRPATIPNGNNIYIPVNNERKHYNMKLDDLKRHFDDHHLPLYFTDEQSCCIFDSVFPILNDLIKFKTTFDISGDMRVSKSNPVYYVYLNNDVDEFKFNKTENEQCSTIYFSSAEIAENCCIWLNYKYGKGNYRQS